MLMTPLRLVVLRLWALSLGRSAAMARLLRWFLVEVLIRRRSSRNRYVASSRFFDMGELDG
ncbi:hypothetical protein CCC_01568 [Paramagnetospirillum magnetotacticum MS-1]|uniref:Uncharacterized protein n=1 Tax=Paramagnetospirillum magnetotacticum MS-1 TaxID=272627 RepID=A0A0C2U5I4_PARME|nr:hypothetical protein [Paramagnetospirillum magnetotacticum]KIL96702.1 hypothetical protein CCC_01568 [Paramagnetospirillum magnetotacticum MS-1]